MVNRGTKEGTEQEIAFVKLLNKKENLQHWKTLDLNPENHFAIHVITKKFGKISGQKVNAKADIYIAEGEVNQDFLEVNDFYLNEDDVESFNLEPIDFTGISVKLIDSKNYQITKMNPNIFKRLFGNYELGAGASIYCQKESDFIKNPMVIEGWNSNAKDFIDYFKSENVISSPLLDKDSLELIKNHSNNKIKNIIEENKGVSDFIFQGIGNFEEPFTAHYLYENGELKEDCYIPFIVTTGSGRRKGIFNLEIKPR